MQTDDTQTTHTALQPLAGENLLLPASIDAANLDSWLANNGEAINQILQQQGAVVIRSLPLQGSKKLEKTLKQLFSADLLEYNYRSTPRTKMRGRIYTSSEYHSDETIFLHNENAYSNEWAMRIAFYSVKAAETGGATPIADSRKVYQAIPEAIRSKFEQKGLMYVRNYGDIDLPWTEVFQTTNKQDVERFCQSKGIEFDWLDGDKLHTRQIANAAYVHPFTGEKVWFNQAHLFHVSSLGETQRQSMLDTFTKETLPRNVYFADGEDIPDEDLHTIREAYRSNLISFPWQEGDLMILDNMLFAHGREPFSGSRRVLVGMAIPMQAGDCEKL